MKNKKFLIYMLAAVIVITNMLSASGDPADDSLSISPEKANEAAASVASIDSSSLDGSGNSGDDSKNVSGSDDDKDNGDNNQDNSSMVMVGGSDGKTDAATGSTEFAIEDDNGEDDDNSDNSFHLGSNLDNFDKYKKPTLKRAQEFVRKNALIVSSVTAALICAGLYKYHKPFKKKVDEKCAQIRTFWKEQHKKPVTFGFMARVAAGVGLLYFVHKAQLDTVITSSARYLYNYYQKLTFSEKCIVGTGLATTTIAVPWVYNKFYGTPIQKQKNNQ